MSLDLSAEILEGFRLSPLQRRLWKQRSSGRTPWVRGVITIYGSLDPERLGQALRSVVSRHEILRTTLRQLSGMAVPVQVVGESDAVVLRSGGAFPPGTPIEQVVSALLESPRCDTPAPDEGPMVYASLIPLATDRHVLVLDFPALIADLPSLSIVFEDLVRDYRGEIGPLHGEDSLPYLEFSEWQNEALESADRAQGEAYWREILGGMEGSLSAEPEEDEPAAGQAILVQLDASQAASLRKCANELGCGLDVLLLAGLFAPRLAALGDEQLDHRHPDLGPEIPGVYPIDRAFRRLPPDPHVVP